MLGIYLIFSSSLIWAENAQDSAVQFPVDELHNTLISIMKSADSTSFQDRYAQLETVVIDNFNTPLISRVVLSRYWKTLDEEAQTRFIALFNRLTIATYVDRFNSYNNQFFENIAIEPMKKNRYLVKTQLVRTDDKPISFNYIVQNNNEQWKIISVIANGINDLSLKRADYSSVIKEQGFDSLIKSLEEKISDLEPKIVH